METLAEVLRKRRLQLDLSLRQVEDKTGISNAYLSQLETQKITQPAPTVLRKIADLYDLSYPRLLNLAGHPVPSVKNEKAVFFRTSSALEEITEKEEKELMEYLRFLRMKRSRE
jgi:transcriptional regulator with XRE-family HTH domain